MIGWFRVPPWCLSVHDEESAPRARAWVYLLGAWDAGDDPPTREVRRVTGFGQGRADTLVRDVAAWAIENGARLPDRVAEQHRSRSGAGAEQADKGTTPKAKQQRSGIGAASEQDRSVSRARFLFQGEETVDVDADEDSAPASGAGTLTPQQQEPPCPDVPTPDSTTPTRPGTAPTATGLASGLTHGMTVPHPTTTPRTVGGSPEHLQAGEPSATSFGDEPPPPSDEDYYASETMDGLPAFDAVNGLLDGAHRGDGAEADRGVEGAPPAPQRRTAAVDAVGSEGARGVGQVVQSGDPRRGAGGHPQGRDGVDRASGANGVGGPERRPGSDGVGTLGADPGRPAPVGLFGALNGPSSASTGASHATAPAEGVAGKGGASGRGKAATAKEPKPSKTDTPFRRRVSDQFGNAFRAVFGVSYPWVFKGRDHDGHRVTVWIEAAKVKEADPEPGLQRLYGAALAYCRAVDAGVVWPFDEKASTRRFTEKITTWLQTDPNARPVRGGKVDPNQATRDALARALEQMEGVAK